MLKTCKYKTKKVYIHFVKLCEWLGYDHPASRAISYGTYASYREKALHEPCQVLVEHAQGVAK